MENPDDLPELAESLDYSDTPSAHRLEEHRSDEKILAPEVAKVMSRTLAGIEEEILDAVSALKSSTMWSKDLHAVLIRKSGLISLHLDNSPILGTGGTAIILVRDLRDSQAVYAASAGVHTTDRLHIGVNTDRKIEAQVKAFEASNPTESRQFRTWYLFDQDGNYGKLSVYPKEFQPSDSRATVSFGPDQHVMADMTPGDFELAGAALGLLRTQLLGALNSQ